MTGLRRQPHHAPAELDHAEHPQAEPGHEDGEGGDHRRALKLEPPANGLAGPAQRQEGAGQGEERDEHARAEQEPVPPHGRARAVAPFGEAEDLEAQDREDARHKVEEQPAAERQEQRRPERAYLGLGGPRGTGHARHRRANGQPAALAVERLAAGQGQDARQPVGRVGDAGALELQHPGLAVARDRLRRGVVDLARVEREEVCAVERAGPARRRDHAEVEARRGRDGLGRPAPSVGREAALPRGEPPGVGRGLGGPDGHGRRDLGRGGQADVGADEPVGRPLQGELVAGEVWGDGDRGEQGDLAFVAVRDEAGEPDGLGDREAERARRHARWQPPVERRGLARVAGVEPVRVPARLLRQHERDRERVARRHARRRRHELGVGVGAGVVGVEPVEGALRGCRGGQGEERKEEGGLHGSSGSRL